MEELFPEDESIDDLLTTKSPSPIVIKQAENLIQPINDPIPRRTGQMRLQNVLDDETPTTSIESNNKDEEGDDTLPPFAYIIPAPEASKLPIEEAPLPKPTPPPQPVQQKKGPQGLLGRLFQKPGSGRPSTISQALTVPNGSLVMCIQISIIY